MDGGADSSLPDVGPGSEQAIDVFLENSCNHAVRCTNSEIAHRRGCHPSERAARREALIRAVARGGLIVDDAELDACRASGAATECAAIDPLCAGLMSAGVADGEACFGEDMCADGRCTGLTCPTLCVAPLGEGELCVETVECAAGLRCDAGRCLARVADDEGCDGPEQCLVTRVCEGGTCRPRGTAGEGDRCGTTPALCQPSLFCRAETCIVGAGAGEACDAALPCRLEAACVGGTCVDKALPGEPCGDDARCPLSHRCDAGVCVALSVAGGPCAEATECLEGVCVDGVCTLRPGAAACAAPAECASRRCLASECESLPERGDPCSGPCAAGSTCRAVVGQRPTCLEDCGD